MKYVQGLGKVTTSATKALAHSLFTTTNASAAELLLKGAVGPLLLWVAYSYVVELIG